MYQNSERKIKATYCRKITLDCTTFVCISFKFKFQGFKGARHWLINRSTNSIISYKITRLDTQLTIRLFTVIISGHDKTLLQKDKKYRITISKLKITRCSSNANKILGLWKENEETSLIVFSQ